MSLDTIMNLQITVESRAPTQAGFGTPLLFGYHTHWLDTRIRLYEQADDMLDDGFTTDDALYKAAQIVKSQEPSPETFKIGRRVTPLTQVVLLTPKNSTPGFKYSGFVGGKAFAYTVGSGSGATLAAIATGMAALINSLVVGANASASGGVVTSTCTTPGSIVGYDFIGIKNDDLNMIDVTADTTTDDELPQLKAEDDDWYGLTIVDSQSTATGLNAAAWIETQRKVCTLQTCDSAALDPNQLTDIMEALKDSSYARTHAVYHRAIGGQEWLAAGWQAGSLTFDPGSATLAFKTVNGVKVDVLQPNEEAAILLKNGSHYTNTGGLPLTFEGKSGSGEFMDTVRFIDWVYARMREAVLGALANAPKIPFTDAGVDIMRGLILSVIQRGITVGGFAADPAPTVTAPLVKDIAVADRINRILPDLDWTATLAGAIHRLDPVRGRVSV